MSGPPTPHAHSNISMDSSAERHLIDNNNNNNNSNNNTAQPQTQPPPQQPLTRTVTIRHHITSGQALLRRTLTSSLNKLTTDTFEFVGEEIAKQEQTIQTKEDLQFFIDVVVDTAMTKSPTLVSPAEIYADLLLLLKYRCPPINSPQSPLEELQQSSSSATPQGPPPLSPPSDTTAAIAAGSGSAVASTSAPSAPSASASAPSPPPLPDQSAVAVALYHKLVREYKSLPVTMDDPVQRISPLESEEGARDKRKRRIYGLFLTTGHLFNRALVDSNLLREVVFEHLRGSDRRPFPQGLPVDEYIECVCSLLSTIGPYLGSKPMGLGILSEAIDRLRDLRPHITGRIGFVVDDILELNERNWVPPRTISRTTSDIDVYPPPSGGGVGVRPGAFADILRRSQTLLLPGPAYAQYLFAQECRWRASQEGVYYEHTSRGPRHIMVSWSSPEIKYQHVYNPLDPPNVASMSLSRSLSDEEDMMGPPRSPTATAMSPARRPQTPYVRPARGGGGEESFETTTDDPEDVHL